MILWVNAFMFTILNFSFNYLDIAIVFVFIIAIISGYAKGFLHTVINLAVYSVGLFLCFYLSTNLAPIVYDNFIKERVLISINDKIDAVGIDEFTAGITDSLQNLPDFITSSLDLSLLSTSSENIANIILINILEPLILTALKIALYLLVFILFFISAVLIIHFAEKASKRRDRKRGHMTKLKKSDKIAGAVIGAFNSLVIVLALDAVLKFFSDIGFANEFLLTQFNESAIVELLNNINPFNAVTEGLI